jgi:inhibitor of KinA sporulation pathway (predicted exonuclease)
LSHPQLPATIVVYDLEFTAWDGSMAERWLKPGQFREVVQVGAVKLAADSLEEIGEFEVLVKPRLNPELSSYFEALTGIANGKLARRGVDLLPAYERFIGFVGQARTIAFGRDDLVFAENFKLYGVESTLPVPPYMNIAPWLRACGLNPRHAGDVAEEAGIPLAGRKHDALFDARSVALGVRALVARGVPNPFS